jgi:hypothetical protein
MPSTCNGIERAPLSLEYTITFRLLDSRIHPADTQVSRGNGVQQRCGMRSGGIQCCGRCRFPGPRPRAAPAALKRNERPAHGPGQGGERERGRERGREGWSEDEWPEHGPGQGWRVPHARAREQPAAAQPGHLGLVCA